MVRKSGMANRGVSIMAANSRIPSIGASLPSRYRAERRFGETGDGEQSRIVARTADELDAHGEARLAAMRRQRDARQMEQGPRPVEDGIAGGRGGWCLARRRRHQHGVELTEERCGLRACR